jgi:hypothetical protein
MLSRAQVRTHLLCSISWPAGRVLVLLRIRFVSLYFRALSLARPARCARAQALERVIGLTRIPATSSHETSCPRLASVKAPRTLPERHSVCAYVLRAVMWQNIENGLSRLLRARRCVACGCVVALYRCSQASFFSSLRGQKHRQPRALAPLLSAHQRVSVVKSVCAHRDGVCNPTTFPSLALSPPYGSSALWRVPQLAQLVILPHLLTNPGLASAHRLGLIPTLQPTIVSDLWRALVSRTFGAPLSAAPLARPCQPHLAVVGDVRCRCACMCVLADIAGHAHAPLCCTQPLTLHFFPCGTRATAFLSWRMTF